MSSIPQGSSVEDSENIRIVGMNTDKTQRTIGSETHYHVYFTLSESPTPVWRIIFLEQWKALLKDPPVPWAEALIDGGFLLVDCPLQDVAPTYFPALKKAVAGTNKAYTQRVRDDETAKENREDVWKKERKTVEELAALLRFE